MNRQIAEALKPVYDQLVSEGFDVYTYTCESNKNNPIDSLYWYENGRVLNIQASQWYNKNYNPDCFFLYTSYIPSSDNGSGCRLTNDDNNNWGFSAANLLELRKYPTWVRGIKNYSSMDHFLSGEKILHFHKVEE